jgi:hypothetical protein
MILTIHKLKFPIIVKISVKINEKIIRTGSISEIQQDNPTNQPLD